MSRAYLIIQTAFIGDVILATAVLEKLHRSHPDAAIDMVVRKGNEGVLDGHPFLRNRFIWDKKRKLADLSRIIGEVRQHRYDAVINLQRFASSGLLTLAAKSKVKIGFNKNPLSPVFTRSYPHNIGDPAHPELHEVDRCLQLIESIADHLPAKPRIYPQQPDEAAVKALTVSPFITCSPASVWFTKQWPEANWARLIAALPKGYRIYLIGAKSDVPLCERILRASENNNVEILAGKLPLLQSAALMKYAVMNYTNDSAPMHLCSAVNAPVTAIFCSTVPEFGFGPLSEKSFIIQTDQSLPCRPCGLHGHAKCPQSHFRCADISLDQLLGVLPQST